MDYDSFEIASPRAPLQKFAEENPTDSRDYKRSGSACYKYSGKAFR